MSGNPTGWQVVARFLAAAGVEVVFGLPDDDLSLLGALADRPVRTVLCRDQRNAVFMATGYALATGGCGYCVVGRGPAVANAVTGLVEAAAGRVPVVLLATGTDAPRLGTGAFQELDQLSLVRPVVKWATRVEHPDLLAGALTKAALVAVSGAPGPVYVEVPASVGGQPTSRPPRLDPPVPPEPLAAGHAAVETPAALRAARRPIVLVGGGMRHRNPDRAVERFAERIGAAIVVSASGRGAVDEAHPLFCGVAGLYAPPAVAALWRETDLVVALGSRLEETTVEGWSARAEPPPVLQVNVAPADLSPVWSGPAVVADAAAALRHWNRQSWPDPSPQWTELVARCRAEAVATAQARAKELRDADRLRVVEVLDALDRTVPRDRVLVQENGLADMWSYFWPYWTCHTTDGSVVPSEQTTLGFGAAAALGVKLGRPERPVVALVGDGAFRMVQADLATVANAGVGLLYVVLDNGGYGWLQHQLDSSGVTGVRFATGTPERSGPGGDGPVWWERVDDRTSLATALARAWSRCLEGQVAVVQVAVGLDDPPPCLWPAADREEKS